MSAWWLVMGLATAVGFGALLPAQARWVRRRKQVVLDTVRQARCPGCGSGLDWVGPADLRPVHALITPDPGDWFPELSAVRCRCGKALEVYSCTSGRRLRVSVGLAHGSSDAG